MTTGQLAFWLIRAGLFQALMPGRLTVEWSDDELALLEARYCLDGLAYIQRRTGRTADSIRRKASNLDLSSEMKVFTPVSDVAREAGTDARRVWRWLKLHNYHRYCKRWGRDLLMPAPAVNLYLTRRIPRRHTRPQGWWGVHRAAAALGCTPSHIHHHAHTGRLHAVSVQRTVYIDPHSITELQATQRSHHPRPNELRVRDLAAAAGLHAHRDTRTLQKIARKPAGSRPANYTTLTAARAFLSARGHREEMVDTLLRKAILMQGSGIKETK